MKVKEYIKTMIGLLCISAAGLMSFSGATFKEVHNFSLKNVDGKNLSLQDYPRAKGFIIVFTCNHCPFAKLYPQRLNELNRRYKPMGVPLIAISATDAKVFEEDGFEKMMAKAKNERFNYPYLYDEQQTAAKDFHAQKTPHAFVIWKEHDKWLVKYNGAIDDNGAEPDKVTQQYVARAVDELLQNKAVSLPETKSVGCQIHLR